jgi:hypothetical protein
VKGRASSTLHRLEWQWRVIPFGVAPVVVRRSPLVFVDSVAEILGTILAGAVLFVPEMPLAADPAGFVAACASARATRLTVVPTLLEVLIGQTRASRAGTSYLGTLRAALPDLSEYIVSGEPTSRWLLRTFAEATSATLAAATDEDGSSTCFRPLSTGSETEPPIRLVNLYGSTEVTADVTYCVVAGGDLLQASVEPSGVSGRDAKRSRTNERGTTRLSCADFPDFVPVGSPLDSAICIQIVPLPGDNDGAQFG